MPWHCFESRGWIGPYIKDRHKEAGPSTPKSKFLEFGASNYKHCGTPLIFMEILLPRRKACAGHQDQAAKRHWHRTRCSIVEISVPVIASIRLLCQAACDFLIIFFVLYCCITPVDEPQRIWKDLKWSWIVLICSPCLHWINHIGAQASKKHQPMHLNHVWTKTIAAWLLFLDHKLVVAPRCSYSVLPSFLTVRAHTELAEAPHVVHADEGSPKLGRSCFRGSWVCRDFEPRSGSTCPRLPLPLLRSCGVRWKGPCECLCKELYSWSWNVFSDRFGSDCRVVQAPSRVKIRIHRTEICNIICRHVPASSNFAASLLDARHYSCG